MCIFFHGLFFFLLWTYQGRGDFKETVRRTCSGSEHFFVWPEQVVFHSCGPKMPNPLSCCCLAKESILVVALEFFHFKVTLREDYLLPKILFVSD